MPTKVCLVKSMVFSSGHVWIWELDCEESWAPMNWCFWTVVFRRLLWVPWTARRSSQSILKETSPGCSLEGLMLRLKLQYFGHLMRRVNSLENTLMLRRIGGRRKRGRQRMRWLHEITDSMDVRLCDNPFPLSSFLCSQSHGSWPCHFSLLTWICLDLSYSLDCTGVFLPVSNLLSLSIAPSLDGDVFLICLLQEMSLPSSYTAILISPRNFSLIVCFEP